MERYLPVKKPPATVCVWNSAVIQQRAGLIEANIVRGI